MELEVIDRQLPTPIPPGPANEEQLARYTPDEQQAIRLYNGLHDYRHSTLAQDVLNIVGKRENLTLTFKNQHEDSLYATDDKGTVYFLVGSWWDCRFVCRGLLKRRKGVRRARYLFNGQASTGTIQVAHYGEQLQIRYPEIRGIMNRIPYLKKS